MISIMLSSWHYIVDALPWIHIIIKGQEYDTSPWNYTPAGENMFELGHCHLRSSFLKGNHAPMALVQQSPVGRRTYQEF